MKPIIRPIYTNEQLYGLCPICRVAFEEAELEQVQAFESDSFGASEPRKMGDSNNSNQRRDPVGPPLGRIPLTCPNGHRLPALYIVGDSRPTYFVALCGAQGTGKTFLLYSLAKTALGEGLTLCGYNIEIRDQLSWDYYDKLHDEYLAEGKLSRTLGTSFIGLGFTHPTGERADGFNLLFMDPPGEFLDRKNYSTDTAAIQLGHLPLADIAIFAASGGVLADIAAAKIADEEDRPPPMMEDHTATVNLIAGSLEESRNLREHGRRRASRIPGVVAITMADRLEDRIDLGIKTVFGDRGEVPVIPKPNPLSISYDYRRPFTPSELRAMVWRAAYARVILSQLAPNFLSATDSLLEVGFATAFSATGSESEPSSGQDIRPWGVLGLLAGLLGMIGKFGPDDDSLLDLLKSDLMVMRQDHADREGSYQADL